MQVGFALEARQAMGALQLRLSASFTGIMQIDVLEHPRLNVQLGVGAQSLMSEKPCVVSALPCASGSALHASICRRPAPLLVCPHERTLCLAERVRCGHFDARTQSPPPQAAVSIGPTTELSVSAAFSGNIAIRGFPFISIKVLAGSIGMTPSPLSVSSAALSGKARVLSTDVEFDMLYDAPKKAFGFRVSISKFSLQVRATKGPSSKNRITDVY